MAFLISTPQTGVDSILVTYSLLGPVIALLRPLAALLTGLLGGYAVDLMASVPEGSDASEEETCNEECCTHRHESSKLWRAIRYGFIVLPRDIGRAMLLGLIVAGVIAVLVPADYFAEVLGTGALAIVIMMLLGIPVYVCATASVPIAAALIAKGVSPGAAMAFLMTGPATNAAAITTIWKVLGARATLIYLAVVAAAAFGFGIFLDRVLGVGGTSAVHVPHASLPDWAGPLCAVVLLVILGAALFRGREPEGNEDPTEG